MCLTSHRAKVLRRSSYPKRGTTVKDKTNDKYGEKVKEFIIYIYKKKKH